MAKKKPVTVTDVAAPREPPPPTGAKWKRVTIMLTPEQTVELKKVGIDTKEISITTYDLSRFHAEMNN